MKKHRALVSSFLIGIGIGTIIECIISLIVGQMVVGVPRFVESHNPVFVKIVQTILYGGFGIVGNLGAMVYDNKKISLFAQLTIHMLILLIYFSFVSFYLHWVNSLQSYLFNIVVFIIVYLLIWTGIYYTQKRKIAAINAKIKARESK